jgi:YVTN family beta-propeller protein
MANLLSLRSVSSGLFLTASVLGGSAFAAKAPSLLVVNQTDVTVSIVDVATGKSVASLPEMTEPVHGHEAAASADGKTAYVPVYSNVGVGGKGLDGSTMLVIDVASRKITGTVDFGHGVRPHCAVYNAATGLLYVTTELDKTVTVIDPKTLKIVGTVPTGQPQSHMLAVTKDGTRGYTANVGPGTVSVLDMKARTTLAVIPVSVKSEEVKHGGVQRIALSSDDKLVFTSDVTKPRMAVIDTATNQIKTWIELPGLGYGAAATKDGKFLLVCIPNEKLLAVVDMKTLAVVKTMPVPGLPQEVLMRPDGKVAYVSCNVSGQVAVVDTAAWKVEKIIDAGKGADGLAWAQ